MVADADLRERLDEVAKEHQALSKALDWQGQRLARLEERVANTGADIAEIKLILTRLEAVANMGKGALWLTLRIGGFLAVLATMFEALRIARVI